MNELIEIFHSGQVTRINQEIARQFNVKMGERVDKDKFKHVQQSQALLEELNDWTLFQH